MPQPPYPALRVIRRLGVFCAFAAGFVALPSHAGGVHLDGSFGTSGALTGPNYLIPASAGKQAGGNLFHSFSQFDLSNGEIATFQAPLTPATINNILARINSGSMSSIDGTIRSEINGANLYLINPAGFMFGQHAQLDITGSFTATSASSIKLSDGAHFDAHPGSADLSLSSAPVSAFGFLSAPGPITVKGSLSVPTGSGLSLLGGNISLNNASLSAPSGQMALVSTKRAGDVSASFKAPKASGSISLSNSTVDTSGAKGGAIVIRGGQLALNQSTISSNTSGSGKGGRMDVHIGGNTAVTFRGTIRTTTSGPGQAGDLSLSSGSLNLSVNSFIGSQALSTAAGTARAGSVNVNAGNLSVSNESEISTSTFGSGKANLVSISAGNITLTGDSSGLATGIFSNSNVTGTGGGGGGIHVFATDTLEILNGASISADTFGLAPGGNVSVAAGKIYIDAQTSPTKTGIFADSQPLGAGGHGGDLNVQAGTLDIVDGGLISTKTLGRGAGGDTEINVGNLYIDRRDSNFFTGIAADTPVGSGAGGIVRVFADSIDVANGGQISANTFTTGLGGSVLVVTSYLQLIGRPDLFTGISADSNFTGLKGGQGGNVTVVADSIEIFDGARISANTFGGGQGGDVNVTAQTALISGSDPTTFTGISAETDSTTAPGKGGSVFARFDRLTLQGGGTIAGNTLGPGLGGDVNVSVNVAQLVDGGRISADTSGAGNGGSVFVTANDLSISSKHGLRASGIFSDSLPSFLGGSGGRIQIQAGHVALTDGANIQATSSGNGLGGSVDLTAKQLTLDGDSSIAASATGMGMAGSVTISVQDPLTISGRSSLSTTSGVSDAGTVSVTSASDIDLNQGAITVQARQGNAGQIELAAKHEVHLFESQLLAESGSNGGNITIDPTFVILDNSLISANAAAGQGGNITLVAQYFFNSQTPITATGAQAGTVNIESPQLNLANGLVTLPSGVIDASSQIREQCAQHLGLDFSSFLVLGRAGVELSPAELQPSAPPVEKIPAASAKPALRQ